MTWRILAGAAASLVIAWLLLVVLLLVRRPAKGMAKDALRVIPDAVRLIRRLAVDPATPRRSRAMLWLLLAYLVSPIDLVPDFLPVVGFADDAILLGIVLRAVLRSAGPDVVARCWPGTRDGLGVVWSLAGLPGPVPTTPPVSSDP